jgi:hypothetical protein
VWAPEAQSEFWARLDDLAYDIAGLLELLEGETPPSPSPVDDSHPPKPTAYLADVASDVVDEHDALKRDLLRHGYTVLPDPALDQDADLLERCRLHPGKLAVSVDWSDFTLGRQKPRTRLTAVLRLGRWSSRLPSSRRMAW